MSKIRGTQLGLRPVFTGSVVISGSLVLGNNSSSLDDILIINAEGNGDTNKFKINSEGVTILGRFNNLPTPISGALVFSSSGDIYIGK